MGSDTKAALPSAMRAMVTQGHGGPEMTILHHDWPRPDPNAGEVLVQVGACGLNNTDINTRSGWYSKSVTDATTGDAFAKVGKDDPSWGGAPIAFPRIQGADMCGRIVAVGAGVPDTRIGERVITDNWLRDPDGKSDPGYFGSERDGGFAEYCTIPATNALAINSALSDAQLATFSCSYSTAENMLQRAGVHAGDTVLIPGASGGVGSALVQLAKLRSARVIAMASPAKHAQIAPLGADLLLERQSPDLPAALAGERVSVIADVVGGPDWPQFIASLERGGRYVCSGAIAGPLVELDLRTFYLRDLTFAGSTVIDPDVMHALVRYIEQSKIVPLLAKTYPLEALHAAQEAFVAKKHVGNIAVLP